MPVKINPLPVEDKEEELTAEKMDAIKGGALTTPPPSKVPNPNAPVSTTETPAPLIMQTRTDPGKNTIGNVS